MTTKNKFIQVIAIFVIFAATALFLPGITIASVSPTSWDFGELELGSSRAAIVTISGPDTREILLTVWLEQGSSSDFSIKTTIPEGGIQLQFGEIIEIEIVYTPSTIGLTSGSLYIRTDDPRAFPETVVNLSGTGIAAASLPSQPERISVEDILAFFDNSVESGYLVGNDKGKSAQNRLKAGKTPSYKAYLPNGKDKSAQNRLKALRNMIRSTGEIIKEGNNDLAFDKLLTILKKTDGQRSPDSPPDFVKGDGAEMLAGMIEGLMQQLE